MTVTGACVQYEIITGFILNGLGLLVSLSLSLSLDSRCTFMCRLCRPSWSGVWLWLDTGCRYSCQLPMNLTYPPYTPLPTKAQPTEEHITWPPAGIWCWKLRRYLCLTAMSDRWMVFKTKMYRTVSSEPIKWTNQEFGKNFRGWVDILKGIFDILKMGWAWQEQISYTGFPTMMTT